MRSRFYFVLVLSAVAASALAADKEVEELLSKMRKVYSTSRSAIVVTQATMATQIGDVDLTIETTYVRPDKIHAKITGVPEAGPEGIVLKTDGKTVLTKGPGGTTRAPYDPEKVVRNVPVNLETINFWDWKRQLSTKDGGNMKNSTFKILKKETWKNKDWMVLEESAAGQDVFVRYFIDPKTYLIHRTRVEQLKSRDLIMDVKVTKLELNPSIDVAMFKIDKAPDKKAMEEAERAKLRGNRDPVEVGGKGGGGNR